MQTFLPSPDFERTAALLDPRRLGKQRVEALQICNALHRTSGGWINHPVTRMWRGYEPCARDLRARHRARVDANRSRRHTVHDKLLAHLHGESERTQQQLAQEAMLPPWLGRDDLHRSHQSALVRKMPEFCRPLFPDAVDDLEYVWPV